MREFEALARSATRTRIGWPAPPDPVDAIDDGKGRAFQFIIQPASDEAANHGLAVALGFKRPGQRLTWCAVFCKDVVQPLDDIAALA